MSDMSSAVIPATVRESGVPRTDLDKPRILVVDDDLAILELLSALLQLHGYTVSVAASGAAALDQVSGVEFGVVLLDVRMPGMSGTDVLERLGAHSPDTAVVMVTATKDVDQAVQAMKQGAYDVILKPFHKDDVLMRIERAIERRHALLVERGQKQRLKERVVEQRSLLQSQFDELVNSLAREHQMLFSTTPPEEAWRLTSLPKELQGHMDSVGEFNEALIRILHKAHI